MFIIDPFPKFVIITACSFICLVLIKPLSLLILLNDLFN